MGTTTTEKPTTSKQRIERWLTEEQGGQCMWSQRIGPRLIVEGWMLREARLVIVQFFGEDGTDGWELFVPAAPNTVDIEETFRRALAAFES